LDNGVTNEGILIENPAEPISVSPEIQEEKTCTELIDQDEEITEFGCDDVNALEGSKGEVLTKKADEESNVLKIHEEAMQMNASDNNEHGEDHVTMIDENSEKCPAVDSDLYKEFAKQQRLIHFEQTHINGKNEPKSHIQKREIGQREKISTILYLNGYNIKFDVKPSTGPLPKSANMVWDRATTLNTVI